MYCQFNETCNSLQTRDGDWIKCAGLVTCVLSILGSLCIISTHLLIREMKTTIRSILTHVSVMNLTSNTANMIGLVIYYGSTSSVQEPSSGVCKLQAFFTLYGTIGSVLWTLGLAVYLYYRIVSHDANVTKWVVRVLYVVCYTLPLYVSLWLLLDKWLGYSPRSPTHKGWCTIIEEADTLFLLLGDDLWIMLSMALVIVITMTTHVNITSQLQHTHDHNRTIQQITHSLINTDRKMLLLPVTFTLMWVWHLLGNILYVYIGLPSHNTLRDVIIFLSVIGDNAQGCVNFVLFCVLQDKLRRILIGWLRGCAERQQHRNQRELSTSLMISSYSSGELYIHSSHNSPL